MQEASQDDKTSDEVPEADQLRAAMLILDVLERESDFYYIGPDGAGTHGTAVFDVHLQGP